MWFFFAFYFALWSSIAAIIAKKILQTTHVLVYLFLSSTFLFVLSFFYLLITGFPKVDSTFWIAILIASVINLFASYCAYRAIQIAPLSLIAPIAAFNPLFTTLFGFLFLNETVETIKIVGIMLIVIGAYLLHAYQIRQGLFVPIKSLVSKRGVQLSFFSYLLWSITPLFEKTAILHVSYSSPFMVVMGSGFFGAILFGIVLLKKVKNPLKQIQNNFVWLILLAPLGLIGQIAAFTAFSLAPVGIAIAIFKLSSLFTIVLAVLFFKETHIKERLLGGSIMILGVLLLVI